MKRKQCSSQHDCVMMDDGARRSAGGFQGEAFCLAKEFRKCDI